MQLIICTDHLFVLCFSFVLSFVSIHIEYYYYYYEPHFFTLSKPTLILNTFSMATSSKADDNAINQIVKETKEWSNHWTNFIKNHLPVNTCKKQIPFNNNNNNNTEYDECDDCLTKDKKILHLQNENNDLKIEKDKLTLCIYGINQLIKRGAEPNFNAVSFITIG